MYVYRCQQCGTVIERRQSFSDAPLTVCESCGGELRKVLQPAGIIFKGSGFYTTDYKNGGSKRSAESGSSSESHSEKTSDSKPAAAGASTDSTSTSSSTSSSSSKPD